MVSLVSCSTPRHPKDTRVGGLQYWPAVLGIKIIIIIIIIIIIYLLQLGCYPVAMVILHVNKT